MYKLVIDRRLKSAVFSGPRFHVCLSVGRVFHITVTFSPPEYMLETSESPVTLWESTGVCHCVCMAKKQKVHAKWETHSRNSTANCHFLPLLLRVWAATADLCVCVCNAYVCRKDVLLVYKRPWQNVYSLMPLDHVFVSLKLREGDSQRACINRGCLSLVCSQAQVFIGYMKAGTLESCVWLNVTKHNRVVFLCKIKKKTIFYKEN